MRNSLLAVAAASVVLFASVLCDAVGKTNLAIAGDQPKAGSMFDKGPRGIRLVWCPPGQFHMGGNSQSIPSIDQEEPKHVKVARGFWLGQTEVTQQQWMQTMPSAPWVGEKNAISGSGYPATYVSWEDATEFCRVLTAKEKSLGSLPFGWKYALPSEIQWEYACRAGASTKFSFGDRPADGIKHAWCRFGDEKPSIQVVGLKSANHWGLYDMHGNVWEWCDERHITKTNEAQAQILLTPGSYQVYRGGSFDFGLLEPQAAHLVRCESNVRKSTLGFRVALVREL